VLLGGHFSKDSYDRILAMYNKTMIEDVPKRRRIQPSAFESTEEWRMMKADIDKGLKPREALQVLLTPEDKKKLGIGRRAIARFVQGYLREKGLKYQVKSFTRNEGEYIIVQYTPSVRQRQTA
jgi:hypothetical protein